MVAVDEPEPAKLIARITNQSCSVQVADLKNGKRASTAARAVLTCV
jgi:hypothetical protein